VHASAPATLDSGGRNAPSASTEMVDAVLIQTATQHVLAAADVFQFAELAAGGFFDTAADADVDKALDRVVEGLRAVEGLYNEKKWHSSAPLQRARRPRGR